MQEVALRIEERPCGLLVGSGLPTKNTGDLIVHDGAQNTRLGVGADAQFLFADSAQITGIKWAFSPVGFDGDGSDGDLTVSGASSLTRDTYFNNLTIESGATLVTNGYQLFVRGKLTIEGTGKIHFNGVAGSDGVAGAGGAGGGSGSGLVPVPFTDLGQPGADGGGGGGSGTANASGGAGGATDPNDMDMLLHRAGSSGGGGGGHGAAAAQGSAGLGNWGPNGGAGGDATGTGAANLGGGGGGGGGGVVLLFAREIDNAGSIEAKGGAGGAGEASGADKAGNGGGGAGGAVILYYTTASGSGVGTLSAAGGAAGTGGNGGAAGSSGTTVSYNVQV